MARRFANRQREALIMKMIRSIALALGFLVVGNYTVAHADDAKPADTKKDEKKADKKADKKAGDTKKDEKKEAK
jgi:hypothetical protein